MEIADLFSPEGHRYFTDEDIEVLRQKALPGDDVTLAGIEVMRLVCDWRNSEARVAQLEQALRKLADIGNESWKTQGHPMNNWVSRDTVNNIARKALGDEGQR